MDRLSNYYRGLLLFLVAAFFSSGLHAQSIQLQGSKEGCAPYSLCFQVTGLTKTVSSYAWDFGDGGSSPDPNPCHTYINPGLYSGVKVKITYSDNTTVTLTLSNDVTVWDPPTAVINLPGGQAKTVQCYSKLGVKNKFCFTESSKTGKNGNPIVEWHWNFGDGDTTNTQKPCHSYDSAGTYTVSLRVKDSKGCEGFQSKTLGVIVLPDIKPSFTAIGKTSCTASKFTFKNTTDTNGILLKKFYWDFGDGSPVDSVDYTNVPHTYTKGGDFIVTLRIVNQLGCEQTMQQKVSNIIAKLSVHYKDTVCWSVAKGAGGTFTADEITGATYWQWTFGDPPSGPLNVAPYQWSATHVFVSGPKNYSVRFTALHPICGSFDTCIVFHVMGPMVQINLPNPPFPPNNYFPAKPMPQSDFDAIKNNAAGCSNSIKYSYFVKAGTKTVVDSIYCNVPKSTIKYKYDTLVYCDGDTQVYPSSAKMKATGFTSTTYQDSTEKSDTWVWDPISKKGTVLKGKPYYPSSGAVNWMDMHDSNLSTCVLPQMVRFTNNSIKYRLYQALDDNTGNYFPYRSPGNGYKEECGNNYPFASDSMKYVWKFHDPKGLKCTSTVAGIVWQAGATPKPGALPTDCDFSTLVAPYHYYSSTTTPKSGCQQVDLSVKDLVVNCADSTTMMLKQGPPDAWWDRGPNGYCKMNWNIQRVLPRGNIDGNPPRRGFVLDGPLSCTGQDYKLRIVFDETLPSCGADNYWITFDSAASTKPICYFKDPNGNIVKYFNTNTGKQDTLKWLDHGFLGASNKFGWPIGGPKKTWTGPPFFGKYWYSQGDSGCKTVGVVLKVGDCYDTAWYHNYICFEKLTANFNVFNNYKDALNNVQNDYLGTSLQYASELKYYEGLKKIPVHPCHPGGTTARPDITVKLVPSDPNMNGIYKFTYNVQRREFPSGDYYYQRPFWPDTAVMQYLPLKDQNGVKKDSVLINPFLGYSDSITSFKATLYQPDTGSLYTNLKDNSGNLIGKIVLGGSIALLSKTELDSLNKAGHVTLQPNSNLAKYLNISCYSNNVVIYTSPGKRPVPVTDSFNIVKLSDPAKDDVKRLPNGRGVHDSVSVYLPYPGFYSIYSRADNIQGCADLAVFHLIYGHLARFNVKGGDSIICVGDTVEFEHFIRYWTTQSCPPPLGSPPPDGCINGLIDNYTGILTAWDIDPANGINKPSDLRKLLNPSWTPSPLGYQEESWAWNFGDNISYYAPPLSTPIKHKYTKPGVYNVTMRTTDSAGCTINTVRHNFIKVIGVKTDFTVTPLRDTLKLCAPVDVVLQDLTQLLGGNVPMKGKFAYKDKVVKKGKVVDTVYVIDSLIAWKWDPGSGVPPIVKTSTDTMKFNYTQNGRFGVDLRVYTANKPVACQDELYKPNYIHIYGPTPKFHIQGPDSGCWPLTVHIANESFTGKSYEWQLGDGSSTTTYNGAKDAFLKYMKPGKYQVRVYQTDTIYDPYAKKYTECKILWPDPKDTHQIYVTVFPHDPIRLPKDTTVCAGDQFNIIANGGNGMYAGRHKFYLDGTQITAGQNDSLISMSLKEPSKKFQLVVVGRTIHNCVETDTMNIMTQDVKADFDVDTTLGNVGVFKFANKSKNGAKFYWNYGDNTSPDVKTTTESVQHQYTRLGAQPTMGSEQDTSFTVCLVAASPIGCKDSICKTVTIKRVYEPYNVFTPNGDGYNDNFVLKIKGETAYSLKIYNRWGEQVFESNSSTNVWNGSTNNTGEPCATGTYYYVWKFTLVGGQPQTKVGTVTLVR